MIVALVDDLIFSSKISGTARQLGIPLLTVTTGAALLAEVEKQKPSLIVVDLNARQCPLDAVEVLAAQGRADSVVAFLSHVQVELAGRARAAGCAAVMPRSEFSQNLATILERGRS
jgi:CheY-like chemotaxis protein